MSKWYNTFWGNRLRTQTWIFSTSYVPSFCPGGVCVRCIKLESHKETQPYTCSILIQIWRRFRRGKSGRILLPSEPSSCHGNDFCFWRGPVSFAHRARLGSTPSTFSFQTAEPDAGASERISFVGNEGNVVETSDRYPVTLKRDAFSKIKGLKGNISPLSPLFARNV